MNYKKFLPITKKASMTDTDDLNEFNTKVAHNRDTQKRELAKSQSRVRAEKRGSLAQILSDMDDVTCCATPCDSNEQSKTTSANNQMWAVYGDRNYSACEKAVDILPPGQYIADASNELGIHFRKADANLDDLVHLPDSVSEQIINEIGAFWTKEEHFRSFGFLWKRGVLIWGAPGGGKCLGKGTPILMFDGSIKNVENIVVGDVLMGDDSTPRNVLSLARGQEQLYNIGQRNGDDYIVNESHILSLVRSTWKKGRYNPHRKTTDYIDVSVRDYLTKSNYFKTKYFGYKTSIEFSEQPLNVDPYFLGVWLGDGTSSHVEITTADDVVVDFLKTYCIESNLRFVPRNSKTSGKADIYALSGEEFTEGSNSILTELKALNLINNKHIPAMYKINSRKNRLLLLAGLLDSDGHFFRNCFEFSNTNKQLITDTVFLARSLGFKCSISDKTSSNQSGKCFNSQSIYISGHTDQIPTRIKRKQATPRMQIINPLHTSINVTPIGVGDYYGFEIDGNRRFILKDFTVTHNTSCLQVISQRIVEQGGVSIYVNDPGLTAKALAILRRVEPNRPLVIMIEDIDAVIQEYGEHDLLALMDGELQIDNVVFIATTNYPERLDKRFINRPSRFDVVKKIGMPTSEARTVYLKAKNSRLALVENDGLLEGWVKATEGFSIAHMKELIVSVEVFEVPLEEAAKRLKTMMDCKVSSSDNDGRSFGFGQD